MYDAGVESLLLHKTDRTDWRAFGIDCSIFPTAGNNLGGDLVLQQCGESCGLTSWWEQGNQWAGLLDE